MFKIPFKPAGRAPLRDKENTQVEPVDVRSSIKLEPGLKNLQASGARGDWSACRRCTITCRMVVFSKFCQVRQRMAHNRHLCSGWRERDFARSAARCGTQCR